MRTLEFEAVRKAALTCGKTRSTLGRTILKVKVTYAHL